ncbi:hypothetical protein HN51_066208, partial [Arachis hypogaea]
ELRTLIPKGFEVIGALAYRAGPDAQAAIHAARRLRKLLYGEEEGDNRPVIGTVAAGFGELKFFVSESGKSNSLEEVDSVVEEEHSEKCSTGVMRCYHKGDRNEASYEIIQNPKLNSRTCANQTISHCKTTDTFGVYPDEAQVQVWEGYTDWRNRPAIRGVHSGMLAASFVLAMEVLENLAYIANASNLI